MLIPERCPMAIVSISGEPGSRHEELARLLTQKLDCVLATRRQIEQMTAEEFGSATEIPDRAWPALLHSAIARMATEHHVVYNLNGGEQLFSGFPAVLRILVAAPASRRVAFFMADGQPSRAAAKTALADCERRMAAERKRRFGRSSVRVHDFDVVLNEREDGIEWLLEVAEAAVRGRALLDQGLLSSGADAQVQFQARLRLAKFGLRPLDHAEPVRSEFGHPTEEIFARLLDFYRIEWQYEPKSFPLQWDKDGRVIEAFTPDFYLPESDLYIELTTMKQALVTRKNRKIRLLRTIYPHVNIQVFYQKDVQDLILKYGAAERVVSE